MEILHNFISGESDLPIPDVLGLIREIQETELGFDLFLGGTDGTIPFGGNADYESAVKTAAAELGWTGVASGPDRRACLRAMAAILVETTIVSYFDLGATPIDSNGRLPPWILAEHLIIIAFYRGKQHYKNVVNQALLAAANRTANC